MTKVDLSGAAQFFDAAGPDFAAAAEAHRLLAQRSGPGGDFTGWLDLPQKMLSGGIKPILSAAQKIKKLGQVLLVVGIGGSYLGARAAIELLHGANHNRAEGETEVWFMGNTLSPDAINELIAVLGERDFCVNVISKSGGTLEPALGFRVAKALLERKYGRAAAKKHMFVTTDESHGILRSIADAEGYESFVIPADVGGRFSVLTPVGLLPMAVAGIDIKAVLEAANAELHELDLRSPDNPAWQYAAARQHLYRRGKSIEILASYEPSFRFFAEWWKQLYGESEGKNGIGIYPASVEYNADLHSMGQYIQDGPRTLFETVVMFDSCLTGYSVPFEMGDADGLNYLAGRDFGDIARTTAQAVRSAHIAGGVPNITVSVPRRDEAGYGALVAFFEMSCAISAYMSGVNPFDQPGVEAYKKNMFAMLKGEN
ncbi:MAG: glucose-6-phosphate isomerase [Oscillospiraceae bacterium]|nr:glucose-6-phosphate isomerase [Oscillospiraceae bacterium]